MKLTYLFLLLFCCTLKGIAQDYSVSNSKKSELNTTTNNNEIELRSSHLALNKKPSKTLDIPNPLEKDLESMKPLEFFSLDEKLLSGMNKFIQYRIDVLQNNHFSQEFISKEIVLSGTITSKQYLHFMNDTPVNLNNVYGKGLYLAPTMSIGSGNENVGFNIFNSYNFVNSTLDFGYELKTINYDMDIFAGAGFSYNTDQLLSNNIIIFKTGLILNL